MGGGKDDFERRRKASEDEGDVNEGNTTNSKANCVGASDSDSKLTRLDRLETEELRKMFLMAFREYIYE